MKDSHTRTILTISLAVILFWVLFALLGPLFAPFEFTENENMIDTVDEAGKRLLLFSPHAPSERHPFGTDIYGYDVLSSLLFGARYTIFIMLSSALLRTILGFLLGYLQALRNPGKRKPRFTLYAGLPVFIGIYFILFGFIFNPDQSPAVITLIQMVLFVLFGLPSITPVFREKVSIILSRPFIEAAVSCGGDKWWICKLHVIPHMVEDLMIIFSQEIVATLTLVGQLGIFSIFIGGTRLTTHPLELSSITREWGGLIGQNMGRIGSPHWWLILYPMAAYLLLFLTAYTLSQVLENRTRKTYFKASNI